MPLYFVQNGGFNIGVRRMFISNDIDGAFMQYALCAGTFAVLCYGVFYFLRQRRESRNQAQVDFPNFLNGLPHSGDNTSRRVETDWVEFLPSRNRK